MALGGGRRLRLILVALLVSGGVFFFFTLPGTGQLGPSLLSPSRQPGNDMAESADRPVRAPEDEQLGPMPQPAIVDEEEKPIEPPSQRPPEADIPIGRLPRPTSISNTSPTSIASKADCMAFEAWMNSKPGPKSEGKREFPLVRPPKECRTFSLPAMEDLIVRMKSVIRDPDLYRLFENAYPNTLDTMIKWRGFARAEDDETNDAIETDEELTYVITGDIDAMWLRDSASQIYSYLPLLERSSSPDSLASLWRGLINSHARYITISPYCHSFQPPPESGISATHNGAYVHNNPIPPYDPKKVFDCKWELDSLASFLQVSSAYYRRTGDVEFFGKYSWVKAVQAAVDAAGAMRRGTYAKDGKVLPSAWTFTGWTNRGSETLTNDGLGNPVRENGMVRSGFRPSDDACIFQLLVPANMMWAKYLEEASVIMEKLDDPLAANLTLAMREQALGIRTGIDRDAIVHHREFGEIFAYEVDGFGSSNLMDDANIPSLLAMPLWNYTRSEFAIPRPIEGEKAHDYAAVYQNTRRFILSDSNPYWSKGPVLSAVGGPHLGPGRGWPMAATVAALTAYEPISGSEDAEAEIEVQLQQILSSTAGSGVIHETVSGHSENLWTRAWFGWANGLFGELILRMEEHESGLLAKSYQ
jgi:uncharacterized protein